MMHYLKKKQRQIWTNRQRRERAREGGREGGREKERVQRRGRESRHPYLGRVGLLVE